MDTAEAEQRFRENLSRSASGSTPTPSEVWQAFKIAVGEPVDCRDDFAVVQFGDSEVMANSYLDFCREFSLANEEGDKWSEQLHAEFSVSLPLKLGYPQSECSSYDHPSLGEFFAAVEKLPGFQEALELQGWSFEVFLERA